MIIFPAIDLVDKKAVRLFKGDYDQMTIYNNNPLEVALDFGRKGAKYVHLVDLEGAKDGTTPNIEIVEEIAKKTSLKVEIGGGIRNIETVKKYFDAGVDRVILGTAAINDEEFLIKVVKEYKEKIVVGADIKDGYIAIKGWLEKSNVDVDEFFSKMQKIGVQNIICTDISKDGAMKGTNVNLYDELSKKYNVKITASGGVSSIEDVKRLRGLNLYGAIIGKAYYLGAIDLKEAIEIAK